MPLGNEGAQAGRAQVLAIGAEVWVAWQEFDGEETTISTKSSRDGGATWSETVRLASTRDAADHPILVADGTCGYLSWLTRAEGYRLLPLEGAR